MSAGRGNLSIENPVLALNTMFCNLTGHRSKRGFLGVEIKKQQIERVKAWI
jgi:hypothetical protein